MIPRDSAFRPTITIQLLLLIFLLLAFSLSSHAADKKKTASCFSMVYKDQPLKEVLNIASKATGCKIYINKEYAKTSVSGEFYDTPVHNGLKIIVSRLNHTITYNKGGRISIVIYKKVPPNPSTVDFIPAYLGPREPIPDIPYDSDLNESDLDKIALLAETLPPSTLKKIIKKMESNSSSPEEQNQSTPKTDSPNTNKKSTDPDTVK